MVVLMIVLFAAVVAPAERGPIREVDLVRDVAFLASDSLAGRDTGEPGIHQAEEHIARGFRDAGLSPLPGEDDLWIEFPLYRRGYERDGTSLVIDAGGRTTRGEAGIDLRPFPFSDEGWVEAPVVFVGYGITAPEHDYDDYAGIDVQGKIVLVLRHEPGEQDPDSSFDGTASSSHALFESKGRNAREHGAAGMLLVTDPLHHGPDDDLRIGGAMRLSAPEPSEAEADGETFVAAHVSRKVAAALVSPSGHSLRELQSAVEEGSSPAGFALDGVKARIAVRRSERVETVAARNIAGFLEGRDPQLKDEWILIGGHHDHIGGYPGSGDTVFNGADDNASGTAGVLALARAFAERSERPRRSLAFVTFSAEEKGLLGSRALLEQELIPIDKIAFMLNLDMIGRNPQRPLQLIGDGYTRGLRAIAEAAGASVDLKIDYAGSTYLGNSDHDPFYATGIPFAFFFTGVHDDYHQLGDHPDKLDYSRMRSILELAYGIVERLAEADSAPRFVHHIGWLGAQVEVSDEADVPFAVVSVVDEASRASEFGLRSGDVVTAFDGRALDEPADVGRRFAEVTPGSSLALGLRRGESELTIEVARARVGYLGVAPEALDADQRATHGLVADEGFRLRQVVADGPAERGGLEAGDIVIRIDGRRVGSTDLSSRLAQIGAGETVEITVIRGGEWRTSSVTLGERPNRR